MLKLREPKMEGLFQKKEILCERNFNVSKRGLISHDNFELVLRSNHLRPRENCVKIFGRIKGGNLQKGTATPIS